MDGVTCRREDSLGLIKQLCRFRRVEFGRSGSDDDVETIACTVTAGGTGTGLATSESQGTRTERFSRPSQDRTGHFRAGHPPVPISQFLRRSVPDWKGPILMQRDSFASSGDMAGTPTGVAVSRRALLRGLAGLGAGLALASSIGTVAARSTDSLIVNMAGARLRSGPGTGYATIASLAQGTEVRYLANGGTANGYRWSRVMVLATGKEGYMAASLLSAPGTEPPVDPVFYGTARTTAAVNLRAGSSTGDTVLRVVPQGATVRASNSSRNGFLYVSYDGQAGWIADQYLRFDGSHPGGDTFTVTANLNLRAEPSTAARVLLVIPSGATVQAEGGTANGWRQVSYKATVGWASTSYLN